MDDVGSVQGTCQWSRTLRLQKGGQKQVEGRESGMATHSPPPHELSQVFA